MTQASRSTLRDLRTRLQNSVDTTIVENTSGLITATQMDTVLTAQNTIILDLIDSADILDATSLAPAITEFNIESQSLSVDAGTTISGTLTFDFLVRESDNVDGLLTLAQGVATLASNIDPKAGSVAQAVNPVTLNAGESVTWTLSGNALPVAGGAAFSRTVTITAREPDDYIYWGVDADGDPSNFDTGTAEQAVFAQSQSITIPTYSGAQHIVIAQKSSDPPIRQILYNGVDWFQAFTETTSAFNVNAASYDALVSDNALLGSIFSGAVFQIVR